MNASSPLGGGTERHCMTLRSCTLTHTHVRVSAEPGVVGVLLYVFSFVTGSVAVEGQHFGLAGVEELGGRTESVKSLEGRWSAGRSPH